MSRWDAAMRLALEQAGRCREHGDVPVGAVLLDPDDAPVAYGRNERELTGDPTAHAEILALRSGAGGAAGWRLEGHTLVVTLEPCTMCAGALVQARVSRLVVGAWDPKAGAVASLWDVVRDPRLSHRVEVVPGVLATACGELLRSFFADHRKPPAAGEG